MTKIQGGVGASPWARSIAALICIVPVVAWADADSARTMGAAWLIKQQRGDGSWASATGDLGVQATAAAILALKNSGLSASPSFGSATTWLGNVSVDSVDSVARKVAALAAAGQYTIAQTEANRLYGMRTNSNTALWSGYGSTGNIDFVDSALGLNALRTGDSGYAAKLNVAASSNTVFSALCSVGLSQISVATGKVAWPLTPVASLQPASSGRPSLIATALLVNELRMLQKTAGVASLACPNATTYVSSDLQNKGLAWILDQQNADGGFGEQRSDGSKGASNAFVTALVYQALSNQATVSQPQTGNALAWLLAKQNSTTGSWDGDPFVTASVIAALPPATASQLTDTDHDGLTNVVEQQLGTNTAVADSRTVLKSPTLAVTGTTTTAFSASAVVSSPFNYSVGSGSAFTLSSGSLPPGLQLNAATGQITGTPTQGGSYGFEFTTSSNGDTVVGRIDVADAPPGDADTPIPIWALLSFGASLLEVMRRRRPVLPGI